jgi:hypothetical protein
MGVLGERITAAPSGVSMDDFLARHGISIDYIPLGGIEVIRDRETGEWAFSVTAHKLNEHGNRFMDDNGDIATEVVVLGMPLFALPPRKATRKSSPEA